MAGYFGVSYNEAIPLRWSYEQQAQRVGSWLEYSADVWSVFVIFAQSVCIYICAFADKHAEVWQFVRDIKWCFVGDPFSVCFVPSISTSKHSATCPYVWAVSDTIYCSSHFAIPLLSATSCTSCPVGTTIVIPH